MMVVVVMMVEVIMVVVVQIYTYSIVMWVDSNASFSSTKWNINNSTFKCHQCCQSLHLITVHISTVSNTYRIIIIKTILINYIIK